MRTPVETGPWLVAADSAGRVGRVMAGTPSSPPGTKYQSGKLWKYCIGLMTWLHAKLILNNHFVLSWKLWLVFHKTFFCYKKISFDWRISRPKTMEGSLSGTFLVSYLWAFDWWCSKTFLLYSKYCLRGNFFSLGSHLWVLLLCHDL